MGIIGKVSDWYQRHRVIRAFTTAAEGVALFNGSAADAAAVIFFNKPVAASVAQAEEQSPWDISGDVRTFGRYVKGTAGFDRRAVDARARLNLDYEPTDYLNLGARGVAEYSTHPPFDHRFVDDHYEFYVDRAFADLKIDDQFRLMLGAYGNTLTGWHDADVPFVGGQLTYSKKDVSILDRFGAKLLYHGGQPWLDESESKLLAIELEGGKALTGAWSVAGNLNYMHWFDMDRDFIRTNLREGSRYANDFRIANAGVKFINGEVDVPVFGSPLALYAKGMHNFGASQENDGYILGFSLGSLKEAGDSSFCFEFRHIEADAVNAGYAPKVTPFSNFNKYVVIAGYQLTKNTSLMGAFAFPEGISDNRGSWVYGAFGLCYKF